jgi:Fe(3+) dicitrate transport protein
VENDLKDKKVEYAPDHIVRWGLTYRLKGFSITLQQSRIAEVYTDASNTELPNAAATTGKISAYSLWDASLSYLFMDKYRFTAGLNNLTDEHYATRRAGGYPGPGLLPGEGRNIYAGLSIRF